MRLILRQNSEDIRKKITEAGIDVCVCAQFNNAVWLDYLEETRSVHGVGYFGAEHETHSVAEEIGNFILECSDPYICRDVEEFIEKIKSL